ncbi:sirohydrochlorin ferrochelatase [Bradyrhizobium sp. USDA 3240]
MTQVYFHCSNTRGVLMDRRGTSVTSLSEACEAATRMMRSLAATVSLEDWRDWAVHVSDEDGEEIVILPFAFVLGKPH